MALITLRDACISIGKQLLLDHVNLNIEPGEHIGLIGRNGAGKSTLMKLINREIAPDAGEVIHQTGTRIARLEQEVPVNTKGSIFAVIADGLGAGGKRLATYLQMSEQLHTFDDKQLDEFHHLQEALDQHHDWNLQSRIEKVLSELNLTGTDDFASLSGGMKRRVLLGRCLVQDPELLMLDEPTNHLDIDSILWLENFLLNYRSAFLLITHDRAFIQKLATRIVEIDRGILTSFTGSYTNYQVHKAEMLDSESKNNALFDKRLAQEEVWIRQGIKARRCRNEGRVRALEKLRVERSERRNVSGNVSLAASMAERSGHLVIEAKDLCYGYEDGRTLVKDFSITIQRGDKIGIIGPNGCGKTTLLNLLLGKLKPDSGTVRLGQNLKIVYFDQLRELLDPEASVADNVMEGSNSIEINGQKKHIIAYLQDFLFAPERARSPVKALSGGERNRLLLAKLFAKPANVMIMDEPTNDLDAETLDLLEEMLIDYPGTLIVVSHDREFLNNVATSSIAFEGEGQVYEYIGGYDDWVRQRRTKPSDKASAKAIETKAETKTSNKPKLTYSEQHKLKEIEARIVSIEAEQAVLQSKIADAAFYQSPITEQQKTFESVKTLDNELEALMQTWEELEAKQNL
ncbi:MAG: ATP-binding cassette domain-containing protein [Gammaproteobacteria bacterium]|nr:ATP-binding cassette domain-containing protein [Gammaproteobacteria bacterium]